MADVRTPELVINKLSKQQYENIQNPSDTEFYLVPEDEEHKPICYPTTVSEVTATSMVVKSSVSDNGKILTENGFVYNTSGNPTVSDTKVICDLGVGFFEKKLENLTINTQYYIKSYGQNASGLVYGSELVQRTLYTPIPDEYQLVEYLESTGTQYINLELIYNQGLLLEFTNVFFNIGTSTSYRSALFGNFSNSAISSFFVQRTGDGNRMMVRCNTDIYFNVFDVEHNLSVDSRNNKIIVKQNNITVVNSTHNGYCNGLNMELFRYTGTATQYFKGKLYNLKITNVYNVIIRNMYPVYRIADNKSGMYDIVNGVFYTNQGTGEFIVGPDKEWGG